MIAIAAAAFDYVLSGKETDRGALARRQIDERQMLLRWQAWSFSAHLVFAATAVGALVAAVLRDPVWPFSLFVVFQVAAFTLAWRSTVRAALARPTPPAPTPPTLKPPTLTR